MYRMHVLHCSDSESALLFAEENETYILEVWQQELRDYERKQYVGEQSEREKQQP